MVARSARASLISIYNLHLLSLSTFEKAERFVEEIIEQVVLCMDKLNNTRTRHNAAHCLVDICDRLTLLGSEVE